MGIIDAHWGILALPTKLNSKSLLLALALTLPAMAVGAAGLGRLAVQSALGEPLRAEIELSASREEYASLSAHMASIEAYKNAGINYSQVLAGIRFALDRHPNSQPFLKVTSERPLYEPFIDMLVELNWASDRLLREYTFLLDPADSLKPSAATAPRATTAVTMAPEKAGGAARVAPPDEQTLTLKIATNLNTLARQRYPDNRPARDEFRRLMVQARPELFSGKKAVGAVPLPAGTVLGLPANLPVAASGKEHSVGHDGKAALAAKDAHDRLKIGSTAAGTVTVPVAKKLEQLNLLVEEQGRLHLDLSERLKKSEIAVESLASNLTATLQRLKQVDADRARAVDEKIKAQASLAKEQAKFGFIEMLLLLLGCGGIVAALIFFYDRLQQRRQRLSALMVPARSKSPLAPIAREADTRAAAPDSVAQYALRLPATAPTAQSAAQNAPQPASKPVPQPASQPASQPTTQPAKLSAGEARVAATEIDDKATPLRFEAPGMDDSAEAVEKFWVTRQPDVAPARNVQTKQADPKKF